MSSFPTAADKTHLALPWRLPRSQTECLDPDAVGRGTAPGARGVAMGKPWPNARFPLPEIGASSSSRSRCSRPRWNPWWFRCGVMDWTVPRQPTCLQVSWTGWFRAKLSGVPSPAVLSLEDELLARADLFSPVASACTSSCAGGIPIATAFRAAWMSPTSARRGWGSRIRRIKRRSSLLHRSIPGHAEGRVHPPIRASAGASIDRGLDRRRLSSGPDEFDFGQLVYTSLYRGTRQRRR